MNRMMMLAAACAMFALVAVSAQEPSSPVKPAEQSASPAKPTSPTYPTPAPVANPPDRKFGVLGPAPNFTGNTTTLDPAGYTVGRRVFEAGSHNATWHMHTAGQLVFGEAGHGRLQIQGQAIKELGVGDSAYIPGGAYHWHGASPKENFTMMFVTMGQSKTTQGDPVTEAIYLGKK